MYIFENGTRNRFIRSSPPFCTSIHLRAPIFNKRIGSTKTKDNDILSRKISMITVWWNFRERYFPLDIWLLRRFQWIFILYRGKYNERRPLSLIRWKLVRERNAAISKDRLRLFKNKGKYFPFIPERRAYKVSRWRRCDKNDDASTDR